MNPKTILTNSCLTTFKTCPRKYQFQYEMGYNPKYDTEALTIGKLVHAGIEYWANNRKNNINKIEITISDNPYIDKREFEYILAKARAMVDMYIDVYKDDNYETVLAESEGRAPLINVKTMRESSKYEIGFKIDRIVRNLQGKTFIIETKTTSEDIDSPDASYFKKLYLDPQVSTYYLGAEVNGIKVESCIYDVIRKPNATPFKATPIEKRKYKTNGELYSSCRYEDETPGEFYTRIKEELSKNPQKYYIRKEITRSDNDLLEHMYDMHTVSESISLYRKIGKFPRHTNACTSTYGACVFLDVCTNKTTLEDTSKFEKIEGFKHKELSKV